MAKLKWSIEDADAAREFIGQVETDSSLASPEDVASLKTSLAEFDTEVAGGWNPAAAASPWQDESPEAPSAAQAKDAPPVDYQAQMDAAESEGRKYADGPRANATKKLANSGRVDWYPEDGGEDGLLGQKRTAHNYREPTPEFLIRYLQRAMNDAPDSKTQEDYTDRMRELHAHGTDSNAYAEMADNLWDGALRTAQKHAMPIVRIEKKDIQREDLLRDVDEKSWGILEPAMVGFEKGATFGLGREAVASMGATRVYGEREGRWQKEMEELGLSESFGEQLKEADAGGWRGKLGSVAEFGGMMVGLPKLVAGQIAKAGARTFMSGAKATPALLRGTSLGQGARGGMSTGHAARTALAREGILKRAKRVGLEGGAAGGIEGAGEAGVRMGGRAARGESSEGLAPADPLRRGMEGAALGGIGGATFGMLGGIAKAGMRSLRRGESEFTQDLARVQQAFGDERITSGVTGIKETPGMLRATNDAMDAQHVGGSIHKDVYSPSEMAIKGVDRKVMAANRGREERVLARQMDEMDAFYTSHPAKNARYTGAANEMLNVIEANKGTPFEDAGLARKAFAEITDFSAYSGKANAEMMAGQPGHISVVERARAVELFGEKAVKAKMSKLEGGSSIVDEHGKTYTDTTYFVIDAKSVAPKDFDKSIRAVDRKINYDKTVSGKDPVWGNLRHHIAEGRKQVGGWQEIKDRHHLAMNEVEDRWRALDLTQSFKDLPMTSSSEDAVGRGIRSGLAPKSQKKRGFYDAMGEDPEAMRAFNDARAIPARDRLLAGTSTLPGSQAEFKRIGYRALRLRADAVSDPMEQAFRHAGGRRTAQVVGRDPLQLSSERERLERQAEER